MQPVTRRRLLITGAVGGVLAAAGVGRLVSGSGGNILVPGRSRARSIVTDTHPPESTDVTVIGGGLVGVSTAFYLAKRGVAVTLCEKGAIAGEASGRAFALVTHSGLDPIKFPIIDLSKRLWSGLNTEIGGETGFRPCGLLAAIASSEERDFWHSWLEQAREFAPNARVLSAQDAQRLIPSRTKWLGAFQSPSDSSAEPTLAAPAIAEGARKLGAKIVAPCAVRGFETSAGRISHVITERGAIRTSAVVLAGGCWSTLFAERAGLTLPSLNVFSSVIRVRGNGPASAVSIPGLDIRPQIDGNYVLGATSGRIAITPLLLKHAWQFRKVVANPPWDIRLSLGSYFFRELREGQDWSNDAATPFESNRILQPAVNEDLVERLLSRLQEELPEFAGASVLEKWGGALNVTPDNVPVISSVDSMPGLFLATGFSYGITMGPAAGMLMSELVTGSAASIDLKPYRYGRFSDGSELTLTH